MLPLCKKISTQQRNQCFFVFFSAHCCSLWKCELVLVSIANVEMCVSSKTKLSIMVYMVVQEKKQYRRRRKIGNPPIRGNFGNSGMFKRSNHVTNCWRSLFTRELGYVLPPPITSAALPNIQQKCVGRVLVARYPSNMLLVFYSNESIVHLQAG